MCGSTKHLAHKHAKGKQEQGIQYLCRNLPQNNTGKRVNMADQSTWQIFFARKMGMCV